MKRLRQISLKEFFEQAKQAKQQQIKHLTVASMEEARFSMSEETRSETESQELSDTSESTEQGELYHYFNKISECCSSLPPLQPSEDHTITFNVHKDDPSIPYPEVYTDKWDKGHVRLPCSPHNLYPIEEDGKVTLKSRWELIEKHLLSNITNSRELEEAILKYNTRHENQWNFSGLHDFFDNVLTNEETVAFFKHTLPAMVMLALQLPNLCTQSIPLLKRHKDHKITLNQKQIGCLLANAFFCTFPRRNTRNRRNIDPEYVWYPDINLNRLFIGNRKGIDSKRGEKLKCLFNYFRRITSEEPKGAVTFHRVYLQTLPEWNNSTEQLTTMCSCAEGLIEKEGAGMLQVDFANKMVGGGVLGLGLVQEEIRFVLCPELIIARLFTERLDSTEVLAVTGCEQFNNYSGYSNTFKWAGNFQDKTPWDSWKRRCTRLVAMDALPFHKKADQYKISLIKRELNKAFTGFTDSCFDVQPAVATGNWGCGVYLGDSHLKSLIQLMAASQCHRDIVYFTFGDHQLQKDIQAMYEFLQKKRINVGDLWKLLESYSSIYTVQDNKIVPELYAFIYSTLSES